MPEQPDVRLPERAGSATATPDVFVPAQRSPVPGPNSFLDALVPVERAGRARLLCQVQQRATLAARRHARIGLGALAAAVLMLGLAVAALRTGYDAKPGAAGFTAALVGVAACLAGGALSHAWQDRRTATLAGHDGEWQDARLHRLPAATGLRRGYLALEVAGRLSLVRCESEADVHHLPELCEAAVLGWPAAGHAVVVVTADLAPFAGWTGRFHRMMPRAARRDWTAWVAARRSATN